FSTVSGSLLKSDILTESGSPDRSEPVLLAARFQSSRTGPVKLRISGLNSPKAWLDGKPVSGADEIETEIPAGQHALVLKVDPRQLPESIRIESQDVSFLVD